MKKEDRSRLRREYEYHKGCTETLSWVALNNPSDELIEDKLDKIKGRMETIMRMLKILDSKN